jgi:TolB-like protein
MNIDAASVLAELECVLASHHFRSRKVLQAFLRYIVTQTLTGNAEKITQYAIAVEGLGKSADFNSATDPLVRIQAGRLRKLLDEYYASEGRFDAIRITLTAKGYHAIFTYPATPALHSPVTAGEVASSLSQGPSIVCIPRTFVADEASGWAFITRLTRDYVNVLTRFNFCQVIFADETPWRQANWPNDTWDKYGADFALFLDLHAERKGYSLKCSLVQSHSGQVVWADSFDLGGNQPSSALLQPIFKRITHDTLGYEQGVAHTIWARQLLNSGKPIAAHHQVMIALRQQLWEMSPTAFRTSLQTCERRLEQVPNDIQAMIVYADHCRADYLLKYKQIESLGPRMAYVADALLQLAPGNAYSHLYYALSCLLEGEQELCLEAVKQAQAINPLDTHLHVISGVIHIGLGEWRTGTQIIQKTIEVSPLYPDWYHIPLSLFHFREGRYLAAKQEAQKIKLKHIWEPMLHAALAQHNYVLGNTDGLSNAPSH